MAKSGKEVTDKQTVTHSPCRSKGGARRIRKVLGIKQLLPTFRRAGRDKL